MTNPSAPERATGEQGPSRLRARAALPGAVVALGLTSFFNDVASEMIFPLLPVFLGTLGAGAAFLGLVEGLADGASSLLKLGSGYLADRMGKKKGLVMFGYLGAAVVRPVVAVATAPWHVLLVRVTDRVGKGIRSSPRDALIAAVAGDADAGRAFGFHRAMDHAGAMVGPLVATLLLELGWPMRKVFLAALVPGVIAVVFVAIVREPGPSAKTTPSVKAADPTSPPRADPTSPPRGPARSSAPLPARLKRFLAIVALFSLGNSSDAFLLLRARDLAVPVASLPILWTVFHASKSASAYLGGGWADRVARPKLIVSGWMVYVATYIAFGLATDAWQAWLLFVVYGAYYGLTEPAEKALVKELAPAEARGKAYGLYNFIVGASAIPAGLLTGWLWQTYSPLVALSTGALLAAAAALSLMGWATVR